MTRILISSDNVLVGRLLCEHLIRSFGYSLIEIANSPDETLAKADSSPPDLLVADATMVGAAALIQSFAGLKPSVRSLVFGLHKDEEEIVQFAEAGAASFALRDADLNELGRAIKAAIHGEHHCSPWTTGVLLRHVARTGHCRALPTAEPLTAREAEIAYLLEAGQSNKEIARELSIEPATAKNHVHNILRKLNVSSRAKAAAELRSRRP